MRRGHAVWGVDASPAMVAIARGRVPQARFEVADVLGVRVPPCDAAAMVGEVLGYALADRPLSAADNLFARVHAALAPGGVFLFDVATVGHPSDRHAERRGPGWRVEADIAVEGNHLSRTIRTTRTVAGSVRTSTEVHRERLLEPDWVGDRLEAAGFAVERLGAYDDFLLEQGWDAFLGTSNG